MAMKTASPWWFSVLFGIGLLLVFLGERAFGHLDEVRALGTGLGLLVVAAVTGLRVFTYSVTSGDRRRVERALLGCHAGALLALALYSLTTDGGRGLIGLGGLENDALLRYTTAMGVVWSIVMVVTLVPMIMIEASLGTARRGEFSPALARSSALAEEAVEAFRVREMASSGLLIALAASLLMVTCNIAEQRNIRRDLSYFKTSSPGTSTINIARSARKPIRALLFMPEVSQVTNEVSAYFEALRDAGGQVTVEVHDRMVSAPLAREFRVQKEGTVVLAYDDKSESFVLTVDPDKARTLAARMELRELDGKVNAALLQVVRQRRIAYMTVGHGELNDELGTWGFGDGGSQTGQIERRLRALNYDVETLGLVEGVAGEIPEDADLVLVMAPREPLPDATLDALDRYLARGGKLLMALDPESKATLGPLEKRLGVRFAPAPITDDRHFVVRMRNLADRRIIITDRFSSHASVTSLGRSGPRQGVLFINAGSFDNAEVEVDPAPRRTYAIRSMETSFADLDNDFQFDEGSETRRQYSVAVAIEDPEDKGDKDDEDSREGGAGNDGMRAMLFADADVFIDLHQVQFQRLGIMFSDAVKWLGGEENIAGEIETEQDIRIEHTRSEDVMWFYATILGAPLMVLLLGLWIGWWGRQRTQRRRS
ncbi:Gldg family protein [Haliangium sp.]|uniref:Gldg family protein n=1 Tax=Haliangium sp. TaxID=2663208 RepID=UPI003D13897B